MVVDEERAEEPGKIPHEFYPEDTSDEWFDRHKGDISWLKKNVPVYFSVDSTALFIILAYKYHETTHDIATIEGLWENIKAALEWITDYGIQDRFVRYTAAADGLACQSWKDGMGEPGEKIEGEIAVVEVQGYAYLALSLGSLLSVKMGDTQLATRMTEAAAKLKADFDDAFWDEKSQYYAFALDGENQKHSMVTSNPGHLLFTGICTEEREKAIVVRLFRDDMWTAYGIRTHATTDEHFDPRAYQLGTVWPHDNWIIAEGLRELGYESRYHQVVTAGIEAHLILGEMPEFYGVDLEGRLFTQGLCQAPCSPQAWSLCSVINYLDVRTRSVLPELETV